MLAATTSRDATAAQARGRSSGVALGRREIGVLRPDGVNGDTSYKSFSVTFREKGVHGAYVLTAASIFAALIVGGWSIGPIDGAIGTAQYEEGSEES
jgi:hypothetical protein